MGTKVAVIGCGYWGKNLVRNFHALGALTAVCDSDANVADEVSGMYGVPVESSEDVLYDPDIDAVVIATNAVSHAELAINALEAGKHVFVEKPLALTMDDGSRVVEASRKAERVLMVGHILRYHPAFEKLAELFETGKFGKLLYVYSNRLNFGRFRSEENILWSFAPHDISMILALADDTLAKVSAEGGRLLRPNLADTTITHLEFSSGVKAHVFVSWLHPNKEQKLVVIGDEGMAVFDDSKDWDEKIIAYPHRVNWEGDIPSHENVPGIPVAVAAAEPLKCECQHFLDCIINGTVPKTDGEEGLRVLEVLTAAGSQV